MNECLARNGVDVKSMEKTSHKSQGSVLRARTKCGSVFYLKAMAGGLNDEVRVSCALAEVLPQGFEKPLVCDRADEDGDERLRIYVT